MLKLLKLLDEYNAFRIDIFIIIFKIILIVFVNLISLFIALLILLKIFLIIFLLISLLYNCKFLFELLPDKILGINVSHKKFIKFVSFSNKILGNIIFIEVGFVC